MAGASTRHRAGRSHLHAAGLATRAPPDRRARGRRLRAKRRHLLRHRQRRPRGDTRAEAHQRGARPRRGAPRRVPRLRLAGVCTRHLSRNVSLSLNLTLTLTLILTLTFTAPEADGSVSRDGDHPYDALRPSPWPSPSPSPSPYHPHRCSAVPRPCLQVPSAPSTLAIAAPTCQAQQMASPSATRR